MFVHEVSYTVLSAVLQIYRVMTDNLKWLYCMIFLVSIFKEYDCNMETKPESMDKENKYKKYSCIEWTK